MMFTGIARLKPFSRSVATARGNGRRGLGLRTSVLALAGTIIAGPALARSAYDGDWSVLIMTSRGGCESSLRYGVAIEDGRIVTPEGSPAEVDGRVAPGGSVKVSVRAGPAWASGTGRLSGSRGAGVWRGEGGSGECAGTWVAQRRGSGAPLYNDAPQAVWR